jgi:hypothetical protein
MVATLPDELPGEERALEAAYVVEVGVGPRLADLDGGHEG